MSITMSGEVALNDVKKKKKLYTDRHTDRQTSIFLIIFQAAFIDAIIILRHFSDYKILMKQDPLQVNNKASVHKNKKLQYHPRFMRLEPNKRPMLLPGIHKAFFLLKERTSTTLGRYNKGIISHEDQRIGACSAVGQRRLDHC